MEKLAEIPYGLLTDESGYPFTGIQAPDWVEQLDRFFAGRGANLMANPLFIADIIVTSKESEALLTSREAG
jgi:hypothetical protein